MVTGAVFLHCDVVAGAVLLCYDMVTTVFYYCNVTVILFFYYKVVSGVVSLVRILYIVWIQSLVTGSSVKHHCSMPHCFMS